jgi:hypothetical protein
VGIFAAAMAEEPMADGRWPKEAMAVGRWPKNRWPMADHYLFQVN